MEIGHGKCNQTVIGLLRDALAEQGRAALQRIPQAERGTSALINQLGRLLQDQGQLDEAQPLLEEARAARS